MRLKLFAESSRTDRGQAEIIPILKSVTAAESGTDLGPVLTVRVEDIFLRGRNEV